MATVFPGSIQTFPTMVDISPTDAPLVAQYQTALQQGNFESAQTILSQIPDVSSKMASADLLNTVMDTVVAVETLFYSAGAAGSGYVVSESQPATQMVNELWFQLMGEASVQ